MRPCSGCNRLQPGVAADARPAAVAAAAWPSQPAPVPTLDDAQTRSGWPGASVLTRRAWEGPAPDQAGQHRVGVHRLQQLSAAGAGRITAGGESVASWPPESICQKLNVIL